MLARQKWLQGLIVVHKDGHQDIYIGERDASSQATPSIPGLYLAVPVWPAEVMCHFVEDEGGEHAEEGAERDALEAQVETHVKEERQTDRVRTQAMHVAGQGSGATEPA